MDAARNRRAAVAGRDYMVGPPGRPPRIVTTVWARRPFVTGSGRRLLAFRIDQEEVFVLVAGSPPRWVLADNVLSVEAARRWLADGFER